jgi:hypothetical protein
VGEHSAAPGIHDALSLLPHDHGPAAELCDASPSHTKEQGRVSDGLCSRRVALHDVEHELRLLRSMRPAGSTARLLIMAHIRPVKA